VRPPGRCPAAWCAARNGLAESVEALLAAARRVIGSRAAAGDLGALLDAGALVIDIRPAEQRSRDGDLPGAVVVDRNVLEWRLDPASPHRIDGAVAGRRVVVVCDEGYQSSLAAATLRGFGLDATDLDGGFQAWLTTQGELAQEHPSRCR